MKKNAKIAIIMNDFSSLDGTFYPLVDDMKKIIENYFEHICTYNLQNRTSPLRVNSKVRTERLFVFRKI